MAFMGDYKSTFRGPPQDNDRTTTINSNTREMQWDRDGKQWMEHVGLSARMCPRLVKA